MTRWTKGHDDGDGGFYESVERSNMYVRYPYSTSGANNGASYGTKTDVCSRSYGVGGGELIMGAKNSDGAASS